MGVVGTLSALVDFWANYHLENEFQNFWAWPPLLTFTSRAISQYIDNSELEQNKEFLSNRRVDDRMLAQMMSINHNFKSYMLGHSSCNVTRAVML